MGHSSARPYINTCQSIKLHPLAGSAAYVVWSVVCGVYGADCWCVRRWRTSLGEDVFIPEGRRGTRLPSKNHPVAVTSHRGSLSAANTRWNSASCALHACVSHDSHSTGMMLNEVARWQHVTDAEKSEHSEMRGLFLAFLFFFWELAIFFVMDFQMGVCY